MTTDILNSSSEMSPAAWLARGYQPRLGAEPPLTWLGRVGRWHLVLHQRVGWRLLVRHHAWVPCCSQRRQARCSRVLVPLRRVLPVLLLHLLTGSQFRVLQLLHVEVLAFGEQLLPLLL